jgi:hypothetical protein
MTNYTTPQNKSQQTIETWPVLGLAAAANRGGGAWRLWTLARSLDKTGRGAILRVDLERAMRDAGKPAGTFRRWLADAKTFGVMTETMRADGHMILYLAGAIRAAQAFGCPHVGTRKAQVPVMSLLTRKWRSHVWAGYIATLKERPVSRATMRKLTGIPERSQQAFERTAGVLPTANWAHDEVRATGNHLAGVREFERPAAFLWFDHQKQMPVLVWRLPDNRHSPAEYSSAAKGRSRKINKGLRYPSSSVGRGNDKAIRIFHETQEAAKAAIKKAARLDLPPWEDDAINEVYFEKPGGYGCNQYSILH